MNGSYFPVLLRVFIGSMWLGLQAYWGGQSLRVLIGAIIPGDCSLHRHAITLLTEQGFAHMKNTFDPDSHLATNDFIALVIWMFAFAGLVFMRPERLQIPFAISFVLVTGSWIGLLIWYVSRRRKFVC
jgi:nucleobase:cation symporter-1, NCS1 family